MESLTHVSGPSSPWRLLEGYRPRSGPVHDELMTQGGQVRPQYETFVRSLETLGRHELASRWENAKRAIRDNGVTYNVYGDPEGVDRPWTLDMIPLLVPSAEWSRLEAALIQRAHVLNLLLSDLYGPLDPIWESHRALHAVATIKLLCNLSQLIGCVKDADGGSASRSITPPRKLQLSWLNAAMRPPFSCTFSPS